MVCRFTCTLILICYLSNLLCQPSPDREQLMLSVRETLDLVEIYNAAHQYALSIDLLLDRAADFEEWSYWEGYAECMIRAAEIEADEIWKLASFPNLVPQDDRHNYGGDDVRDFEHALQILEVMESEIPAGFWEDHPELKSRMLIAAGNSNDWTGSPKLGLAQVREALEIRRKEYGESSLKTAEAMEWIGTIYRWGIPIMDSVEKYLTQALEIYNTLAPNSLRRAHTLYVLVGPSREARQLEEAEIYARQAAVIYRKHGLVDQISNTYNALANVHKEAGNCDQAFLNYEIAIREYKQSGFWRKTAVGYNDLGEAQLECGHPIEAIRFCQEALDIYQDLDVIDTSRIVNLHQTLAAAFTQLMLYEDALRHYERALELAGSYDEETAVLAAVYNKRAIFWEAQGKFEKALSDKQAEIQVLMPGFESEDIYKPPPFLSSGSNLPAIATALYKKADLFADWYDTEGLPRYSSAAVDHYEHANTQIFHARQFIRDESSRLLVTRELFTSVERCLRLCHQLWTETGEQVYFDLAFKFAETSKYMLVFDAVQRAQARGSLPGVDSLADQLSQVNVEMAELQRKFDDQTIPADSSDILTRRLTTLADERRHISGMMANSYPEYFRIRYDSILIRPAQVQEVLTGEQQVLEYFWGQDAIYIFDIRKDATRLNVISRTASLDRTLTGLLTMLTNVDSIYDSQAHVVSYANFAMPVYEQLVGAYLTKADVIVIPDGPLSYLPFSALIDERPQSGQFFGDLSYLIHQTRFRYGYSCNLLFRNMIDRQPRGRILAMSYSDSESEPTELRGSALNRTPLPGSFEELEIVANLFSNVKTLSAEQATKEDFLRLAGTHDWIHLAIHGEADPENIETSKLTFYRTEEGSPGDLYSYELYGLDLKADLVVLSACESGAGRYESTEGVHSIARGFAYAGVPSRVMSLWKVPDFNTRDIMGHFYKEVKAGDELSNALRKAQIRFLQEGAEYDHFPGRWAAFVVNGQDVRFSSYRWWLPLTVLVICGLIVAFVAEKRFLS